MGMAKKKWALLLISLVLFGTMVTAQAVSFDVQPQKSARKLVSATLNQKLSARSGPSTKYTEEGTYPENTSIKLVEKVFDGNIYWGMVEFYKNGEKYRVYTGMKRIDTKGSVHDATQRDYRGATLAWDSTAYYGPGYDYARRKGTVPSGTQLRVYDEENDFYLCDYVQSDGQWVRAYFPKP